MKNSSYYIAPVGVRTHDLPHTVASNMGKVLGVPRPYPLGHGGGFSILVNTLAKSNARINIICIQEARIGQATENEHLKVGYSMITQPYTDNSSMKCMLRQAGRQGGRQVGRQVVRQGSRQGRR